MRQPCADVVHMFVCIIVLQLCCVSLSGCYGAICRKAADLSVLASQPEEERLLAQVVDDLPVEALRAATVQDLLLDAASDRLRQQLDRRMRLRSQDVEAAGPQPVSVLLLSGGGQLGAYGAGAMVGWSDRNNRPEFDVVTGVSTGALIATFAFLGSKYDEILEREYTQVEQRDILRRRPFLEMLFSESLADNTPLAQKIEQAITLDVLNAVADECERGRSLTVGVVELKTGLFLEFDLGSIAAGRDEASLRRYRSALLASAAIPTVFPPVCDGVFAFADGATRQNIYFPSVLQTCRRELERADVRRPLHVYAIVNGTIDAMPNFGMKGDIISIGVRAVDLLLAEAQIGALHRISGMADRNGWTFRVGSISPDACWSERADCGSSLVNQFCKEYMNCLFNLGRGQMLEDRFWSVWDW